MGTTTKKLTSRSLKVGTTYNIEFPKYYGASFTEKSITAKYTGRDYASYLRFEYKNVLGKTTRTAYSTKLINDCTITIAE